MTVMLTNTIWPMAPTVKSLPAVGVIAVGILVVWLFVSQTRARISFPLCTNKNGDRLPEIPSDVQPIKLQRSRELSRMIQQLAGTSPCLIRNGPNQELVISQPDHIQDFYSQYDDQHTKPEDLHLGAAFKFLMSGSLRSLSGQEWRKMRIHFDPPLSFSAVSRRVPRFEREIKMWTKNLDTGLINSQLTFQFVVFRMLVVHLYEDAYDDRMYWRMLELYRLFEKAMSASAASASSQWHDSNLLKWFPIGPASITQRFRHEWQEFNRNIVSLARNGRWSCPVEVISRGVNANNEMTEDAFLCSLGDILFANVNASSHVLNTIFTNLAANQVVQNALRREIKNNEGAGDEYLQNANSLLHRVLLESMRVCSALSFSAPQCTDDAKTIGGYHIPAQTAVVIDAHRVNHNIATWGADCDKWEPDRFLRIDSKDLRYGFMRYGIGPASGRCLGMDAADIIFKLTVMAVVGEFSLDQVDGGEVNLNLVRL